MQDGAGRHEPCHGERGGAVRGAGDHYGRHHAGLGLRARQHRGRGRQASQVLQLSRRGGEAAQISEERSWNASKPHSLLF